MDTGMQHGHGHAAKTWPCSMGLGMMLGDHCSIVTVLNAFHSIFSFTFTVLPAQWPQMMANLTFSSSFISSNNCQLMFLL
jgi:hypothetical protein